MHHAITIRPATSDDAVALRRLSLLDDRRAPRGRTLLAFEGGQLVAARPVHGANVVADPFRRTAHVLAMLETQTRIERRSEA